MVDDILIPRSHINSLFFICLDSKESYRELPLFDSVSFGRNSADSFENIQISREHIQVETFLTTRFDLLIRVLNTGRNPSRVISSVRKKQAKVRHKNVCRLVPGDIVELLFDMQGAYAFLLTECSSNGKMTQFQFPYAVSMSNTQPYECCLHMERNPYLLSILESFLSEQKLLSNPISSSNSVDSVVTQIMDLLVTRPLYEILDLVVPPLSELPKLGPLSKQNDQSISILHKLAKRLEQHIMLLLHSTDRYTGKYRALYEKLFREDHYRATNVLLPEPMLTWDAFIPPLKSPGKALGFLCAPDVDADAVRENSILPAETVKKSRKLNSEISTFTTDSPVVVPNPSALGPLELRAPHALHRGRPSARVPFDIPVEEEVGQRRSSVEVAGVTFPPRFDSLQRRPLTSNTGDAVPQPSTAEALGTGGLRETQPHGQNLEVNTGGIIHSSSTATLIMVPHGDRDELNEDMEESRPSISSEDSRDVSYNLGGADFRHSRLSLESLDVVDNDELTPEGHNRRLITSGSSDENRLGSTSTLPSSLLSTSTIQSRPFDFHPDTANSTPLLSSTPRKRVISHYDVGPSVINVGVSTSDNLNGNIRSDNLLDLPLNEHQLSTSHSVGNRSPFMEEMRDNDREVKEHSLFFSPKSLEELPQHLLDNILQTLPHPSLIILSRVSRFFASITRQSHLMNSSPSSVIVTNKPSNVPSCWAQLLPTYCPTKRYLPLYPHIVNHPPITLNFDLFFSGMIPPDPISFAAFARSAVAQRLSFANCRWLSAGALLYAIGVPLHFSKSICESSSISDHNSSLGTQSASSQAVRRLSLSYPRKLGNGISNFGSMDEESRRILALLMVICSVFSQLSGSNLSEYLLPRGGFTTDSSNNINNNINSAVAHAAGGSDAMDTDLSISEIDSSSLYHGSTENAQLPQQELFKGVSTDVMHLFFGFDASSGSSNGNCSSSGNIYEETVNHQIMRALSQILKYPLKLPEYMRNKSHSNESAFSGEAIESKHPSTFGSLREGVRKSHNEAIFAASTEDPDSILPVRLLLKAVFFIDSFEAYEMLLNDCVSCFTVPPGPNAPALHPAAVALAADSMRISEAANIGSDLGDEYNRSISVMIRSCIFQSLLKLIELRTERRSNIYSLSYTTNVLEIGTCLFDRVPSLNVAIEAFMPLIYGRCVADRARERRDLSTASLLSNKRKLYPWGSYGPIHSQITKQHTFNRSMDLFESFIYGNYLKASPVVSALKNGSDIGDSNERILDSRALRAAGGMFGSITVLLEKAKNIQSKIDALRDHNRSHSLAKMNEARISDISSEKEDLASSDVLHRNVFPMSRGEISRFAMAAAFKEVGAEASVSLSMALFASELFEFSLQLCLASMRYTQVVLRKFSNSEFDGFHGFSSEDDLIESVLAGLTLHVPPSPFDSLPSAHVTSNHLRKGIDLSQDLIYPFQEHFDSSSGAPHDTPLGLKYLRSLVEPEITSTALEDMKSSHVGNTPSNIYFFNGSIEALNLSGCVNITSGSFHRVLIYLPCLRELNLRGCSGLSVEALKQSLPLVPLLESLTLDYCVYVDDSVLQVLGSCCKRLSKLSLVGCLKLSGKAITDLCSECPNLIEKDIIIRGTSAK